MMKELADELHPLISSVGLVNDHARFCFRYKELKRMK